MTMMFVRIIIGLSLSLSPYVINAHGDGCNWLPAKKVNTHTPAPTIAMSVSI